MIAAAGAGKTTFLVDTAYHCEGTVLITTFTIENEEEIRNKFYKRYGHVPPHVTIQTWFSFLIQHGVRPYKGLYNSCLFNGVIKGILMVNERSGAMPFLVNGHKVYYGEENDFMKHYFSEEGKIYTDKLSKFAVKTDEVSGGKVVRRISKIFSRIFIDEVQDLAGYDLEFLKLLFRCPSTIVCVGDPRQSTYHTHWEQKNKDFMDGKICEFVTRKCRRRENVTIDEVTLTKSHRNNRAICDYSSLLYPGFPKTEPCDCIDCHPAGIEHQGVFVVKSSKVYDYLVKYQPMQLRNSKRTNVDKRFSVRNFGVSKGKSYDRVLIYPTDPIKAWLFDHNENLAFKTRACLYVAITRARFSVAFVVPDEECCKINDLAIWE